MRNIESYTVQKLVRINNQGPIKITNNFLFAGTFCGVFRRQALDRGAMMLGANKIVTGLLNNQINSIVVFLLSTFNMRKN